MNTTAFLRIGILCTASGAGALLALSYGATAPSTIKHPLGANAPQRCVTTNDDTPRCKALQHLEELVEAALKEPLATESTPSDGIQPTVAALRERVSNVQRIYTILREETTDRAWLHGRLSHFLGLLWDIAYKASEWSAAQVEQDLASRGLEIERRMLLAALGQSAGEAAVLSGLPLLVVLGDGFRGLAARARSVSGIHDFGCLLLACLGTVGAEGEALWAIWASLTSPAALVESVSRARALPGDKPILTRWQPVFDALARQSTRLSEAVTDALDAPASGASSDLATLDVPVVPLAREPAAFVQEAASRWSSFQKTGFLDWTPLASRSAPRAVGGGDDVSTAARLVAGLDRQRVTAKREQFKSRINDYSTLVDKYEAANLDVMREWQSEVKLGASIKSLFDEIEQKSDLIAYSLSDLEGLRASAEGAKYRFGEVAQQFEAAMQAAAANAEYRPRALGSLNISASAGARFRGSSMPALADYAVLQHGTSWKLPAKRGDIVRFEITGQWAPTCAIRSTSLSGPGGAKAVQVPSDAKTTSEGYSLLWNGSSYQADSKSTRTANTDTDGGSLRGSVCAGAQASCCSFIATVGFYARAEGCLEGHVGHENMTSNEAGVVSQIDERRSMSANTGLRAQGTPFAGHPAGSLIFAHATPAGVVGQVLFQPQSAVVIEDDADYFLVVNDRGDCSDASADALSVTPVILESATSNGEKLKAAMIASLERVDARTPELVKQGRILQGDLAALQSEAMEVLRIKFGGTLEQVPPTVRSFFQALLDSALVGVSRSVEIQALVRSIHVQQLQLATLSSSVLAEKDASRLGRSIARALLDNIDGIRMEATTARMIGLLRDEVLPVLDLRYPGVREKLLSQDAASLRALQQADLGAGGLKIAQRVRTVAKRIDEFWQSEIADQPTVPESVRVIVGIPRPGRSGIGGYAKKMDGARSLAFWNALETGVPVVPIELRPDDVYDLDGGQFTLGCSEGNPVIEDLRLVFLTGVPAAITEGLMVPVRFGRGLTFIDDRGPKRYLFDRDDLLLRQLPVDFAQSISTAWSHSSVAYVGAGLSPFGRMNVSTSKVRDPRFKPFVLGTGCRKDKDCAQNGQPPPTSGACTDGVCYGAYGASEAVVAMKLSWVPLRKSTTTVATPACRP